jgi:hypothetical protein
MILLQSGKQIRLSLEVNRSMVITGSNALLSKTTLGRLTPAPDFAEGRKSLPNES